MVEDLIMEEKPKLSSSISYKDMLTTVFGSESKDEDCWGDVDEVDLPKNKWYKDEEREDALASRPFDPTQEIPLSDEEISPWFKPWKNSYIVKVLGRRVNFKLLKARLHGLWKNKGLMKIIDMTKDLYLVRFTTPEDYLGRSWIITL